MSSADRLCHPARAACAVAAFLAATLVPAPALRAADMTAHDLAGALYRALPGTRPNLSARDLARLDLSNLDFRAADLSRTNLFGADLSGANLYGADLSGATLDRVTLVSANLDAARLDGASLLRPSTFSTLTPTAAEAPSFKGTSMRAVRMFGRFSRSDFSGADLTDATCAPFGKTGFIEHIWRSEFSGANLSRAKLSGADLTHALLSFANLSDADLRGVNLTNADLTGADLSRADLSGADVTGADFNSVRVTGAKGLDSLRGFGTALNTDRMLR